MDYFLTIVLFTGTSFVAYGINSFISKRMKKEFKRWGLFAFRVRMEHDPDSLFGFFGSDDVGGDRRSNQSKRRHFRHLACICLFGT